MYVYVLICMKKLRNLVPTSTYLYMLYKNQLITDTPIKNVRLRVMVQHAFLHSSKRKYEKILMKVH